MARESEGGGECRRQRGVSPGGGDGEGGMTCRVCNCLAPCEGLAWR